MNTLNVNTIYCSFDGEVNFFGIGAPTIFLRLQGCHLRCYLSTMHKYCDTPESLERKGGTAMTIEDIIFKLRMMRKKTGISKVTLSGGDPLYQHPALLQELFKQLGENNFPVTVETSGTLSIAPYKNYPHVFWVLDYKLPSCGLTVNVEETTVANLRHLKQGDFVKFVIYNEQDFNEMLRIINKYPLPDGAKYAIGAYWGGQLSGLNIYHMAADRGILKHVTFNFQTHKLLLLPIDTAIPIPTDL
jgi:organic radical activating enzyme